MWMLWLLLLLHTFVPCLFHVAIDDVCVCVCFVAVLGFDRIPLWGVFILSFGGGIVIALLVRFVFISWQRKTIKSELLFSGIYTIWHYCILCG